MLTRFYRLPPGFHLAAALLFSLSLGYALLEGGRAIPHLLFS